MGSHRDMDLVFPFGSLSQPEKTVPRNNRKPMRGQPKPILATLLGDSTTILEPKVSGFQFRGVKWGTPVSAVLLAEEQGVAIPFQLMEFRPGTATTGILGFFHMVCLG